MNAIQVHLPCNQQSFSFQALGSRKVEADFSGGYLSSDGGSLLLREIDRKRSFTTQLAQCFTDTRFAPLVEHQLPHLLAQRIHEIALGYANINDHDNLISGSTRCLPSPVTRKTSLGKNGPKKTKAKTSPEKAPRPRKLRRTS